MPHTRVINSHIRNIAIIAHVDHGKTTLVDALFKQSGTFRANQDVEDRVMDSMDLERERGITISAKNCAVKYHDVKINIMDTPGHADFGGEVERALSMVDGAILLVDASEGPLPQTRFVLKKALERGLKLIVVINKIDRKDARPKAVLDEVYSLLIDLDADDEQLDFPVIYANGRAGIAQYTAEEEGVNLEPLFKAVIEEIPGPQGDPSAELKMLVSDLSYSDFLGRLCVGRVHSGCLTGGDSLVCVGEGDVVTPLKVNKLQVYQGLKLVDADSVESGDIAVLAGIQNVHIGDTICTKDQPKALKRLTVDEPTVAMRFYRNNGPLSGTEGTLVQPGKIKERLDKEALVNLAIRIQDTDDRDSYLVNGRGEFQLAILIETMRREGYEFCVGRPEVIYRRDENGKLTEPIEQLFVDCEDSFAGVVTEKLSARKCRMMSMVNHGTGRVRMEFSAPSRALIGFRDEFLTDTKGTGLMNSYLAGYEEYRGDYIERRNGSLVSDRSGNAVPYALYNLEPRGRMFIGAGEKVYAGMIIGEHNRDQDLDVNPCKEKKLSNVRASGRDENIVLTPIVPLSLEQSLNFLRDDELLEVTPKSLRLRKAVLDPTQRRISAKKKNQA